MSTSQNPLFPSSIKCPVCNTVNAHITPRQGAYRVNAKDTDFRPSEVIWANPEYQQQEPLQFFMATCSRCFYTREFTDAFKAWASDYSFVNYSLAEIAQKHMAAFGDKDGLIRFLGPRIDAEKYPIETAIIKLILGIHDELLLKTPSTLNVARYFLRIAWLFRGRAAQSTNGAGTVPGVVAQLRREVANADASLNAYGEAIKALQATFDSIGASMTEPAGAADFARRKAEVFTQLSAPLPQLRQAASALVSVSDDAERSLLGGAAGGETYGTYRDFRQFLVQAKQRFAEIPTDEQEALAKAAAYYIQAFERGSQVGDGLPQVQTAYLIAEISRRAGDFETADRYFVAMMKMGHELVHGRNADAASINQTNKLLVMASEQARLSKHRQ